MFSVWSDFGCTALHLFIYTIIPSAIFHMFPFLNQFLLTRNKPSIDCENSLIRHLDCKPLIHKCHFRLMNVSLISSPRVGRYSWLILLFIFSHFPGHNTTCHRRNLISYQLEFLSVFHPSEKKNKSKVWMDCSTTHEEC